MTEIASFAQETCLDLVATVFLLSGGAKMVGLRAFREGLLFIPYMRIAWTYVIGWTLPVGELLIALGLYLNFLPAKLAAIALLGLFSLVIGLVLSKRLQVPCNCFGNFGARNMSAGSLRNNAILMVATLATLWLPDRINVGSSLTASVLVLLFVTIARELQRQYQFLSGLRRQGVL